MIPSARRALRGDLTEEEKTVMRILLVEDDFDVRQYLARALSHLRPSIEVVTAADGREALTLLRSQPFDLVLSDQRMPHMSGLDLLLALRSWSPMPFLLISADRSVFGAAYTAGADEVLTKPISLETLGAALDRYLPPEP